MPTPFEIEFQTDDLKGKVRALAEVAIAAISVMQQFEEHLKATPGFRLSHQLQTLREKLARLEQVMKDSRWKSS